METWKFKKYAWQCMLPNIYNVWVYIITSTQVVKNEKENMHAPHCNFLRRSLHNKKMGGGRSKFFHTYAYNLWTKRFVNNSSQHMNLCEKQHLFWNHKESAKFNNTYMYRVWKETCTVLYLHSKRIDRWNPGSYDKLASAGNDLCSIATCIVRDTAGLLC